MKENKLEANYTNKLISSRMCPECNRLIDLPTASILVSVHLKSNVNVYGIGLISQYICSSISLSEQKRKKG